MKYTMDIICNGIWFNYSKELIDNTPTVRGNFKQKLVNNSQELVKDLVKEKGEEE